MAKDGDWGGENVSADLARANLLRMRGDRQAAIDQCLSILKREPEHIDAHILIAEIYEEMGDLGQAAEWYELALDLDPRNANLKQKLALTQEQEKARETEGTAKSLALPPEKPPTALYICIIAVIALVVGFGAFLSEGGLSKKATEASVPPADGTSVPIVAPGEPTANDPAPTASQTPTAETGGPEEDRSLLRSLAEGTPQGGTLLAAQQDPRNNGLTLTYAVVPEGNEPTVAAEGARFALGKVLSAPSAVVRVAKSGKLTYVATVERTRLAEVETSAWKQANTEPTAWLRHVLQQEWGPAALNAETPPTTPETTPSTGTTAP